MVGDYGRVSVRFFTKIIQFFFFFVAEIYGEREREREGNPRP
jgi:hypothetical protein